MASLWRVSFGQIMGNSRKLVVWLGAKILLAQSLRVKVFDF